MSQEPAKRSLSSSSSPGSLYAQPREGEPAAVAALRVLSLTGAAVALALADKVPGHYALGACVLVAVPGAVALALRALSRRSD